MYVLFGGAQKCNHFYYKSSFKYFNIFCKVKSKMLLKREKKNPF